MDADNLTYAGRPDFGSGCSRPPRHPQAAAQVGARPVPLFALGLSLAGQFAQQHLHQSLRSFAANLIGLGSLGGLNRHHSISIQIRAPNDFAVEFCKYFAPDLKSHEDDIDTA